MLVENYMMLDLSRALILLIVCTFSFCMGDEGENTSNLDNAKLTDAEILSIRTDFTSMQKLEKFYAAEYKILQNHSDTRIVTLLKAIEQDNSEPLVIKRASKVLKIIESKDFLSQKDSDLSALYFSSDFRRRILSIEKLWTTKMTDAANLLFNLVENDNSYDVKIKAIQAIANFHLDFEQISTFIVGSESSDETFAVTSVYVLLRNEPEQAINILLHWVNNPKYRWHRTQAWQILETVPELLDITIVNNLIQDGKQVKFHDSLFEILAHKLKNIRTNAIFDIMNALRDFFERSKIKKTASWEKLWCVIIAKNDFTQYFKDLKNKTVLPGNIWVDIARRDSEYMMMLAFSENKTLRNLARLALSRSGHGIELMKRIRIKGFSNSKVLTFGNLIQEIRRLCHFEIYLSSYTELIRDREIKAYFSECTLFEMLTIISRIADVRYEFDNGRLLIYPGQISYRGFKLLPIFVESVETQEFFDNYIVQTELKPMPILEFIKHLRNTVGKTIIIDDSIKDKTLTTPMLVKNKGLLPIIIRALRNQDVDIVIMANALWFTEKSECELCKNAQKLLKTPNMDNFQRLINSENPKRFQLISNILRSNIGIKISKELYEKYVLEMLNSAGADADKASLILCLGRLSNNAVILDKLIRYAHSTNFTVRTAAIKTLKNSAPDIQLLLTKYFGIGLNVQKIIREIVSKNLSLADVIDFLVKLISKGQINQIQANFKALTKLISSIYWAENKFDNLPKRVSIDISEQKLDWLLQLVQIQTQQRIHFSPLLASKFAKRPKLMQTPISLKSNADDLMETLKTLAFKLTINAELEELLPIVSVYEVPVENTREASNISEFVFTYPFEIEHLVAFRTLLDVAAKIPGDFEKPVFEYLWNLTALDELIECCKENTTVIQFFKKFISELKGQIETLEKDRTTVSPEFARLVMRLRKMLKLPIPEIYSNYNDFPEDWFLPELLKAKQKDDK